METKKETCMDCFFMKSLCDDQFKICGCEKSKNFGNEVEIKNEICDFFSNVNDWEDGEDYIKKENEVDLKNECMNCTFNWFENKEKKRNCRLMNQFNLHNYYEFGSNCPFFFAYCIDISKRFKLGNKRCNSCNYLKAIYEPHGEVFYQCSNKKSLFYLDDLDYYDYCCNYHETFEDEYMKMEEED